MPDHKLRSKTFRWIGAAQAAWLALILAKLLDVVSLHWWALMAPIWVPLLALLALEAWDVLFHRNPRRPT